ncbi:hypothetical protein Y1Q_0021887 [Alligator mississippiensis]|uniref:SCAN box domain-containing protein n=1 Tax=Alligator mississippiensis TaxID=8496 RepID=A0A151M613_ALLMI|nr:hypothetical protein Y1Q_0021887 [Alligator mississippiensis]
MTKDDDPEAYIEAFELMSIQTGLDRSQWGHQLGVLVIDEAQAAYRALSRENAQDYEAVKAAVLYRLEISPESHQQAFRARKPRESKRPRGLPQTLQDALQKWLLIGKFDRAGALDQILLEQFLWDLEEDTQRKLNTLTTFNAFPMPYVSHLIERIGEARYISTLDLAKGYWQIPLRPGDCAKTAFGTP